MTRSRRGRPLIPLLPPDPGAPPRGRPAQPSTPEDRAEALRARVVRAAALAFAEKGYFAATVEDVIARAGMSRRTFYQLFTNREDVLVAFYEDVEARMLAAIEAAVAAAPDPQGRALAGIETWMTALASHPGLARVLLIDAPAAGPRLAEISERAHAAVADFIARLIEGAAAEGRVHRPDPLMPRALVGAVNEVVAHLLRRGDNLPDATPVVFELFVRLLGPPLDGPLLPTGHSVRRG